MRRGCSQEELAEVFGVYLFTVQSAEYKALKNLQKQIENPL
jgi:DNA-directed RNA polymerase specialized sigma24 family protein